MVTENTGANTLYRQNKVEAEKHSHTVRNFMYLIGQRMSLGKICTFTALNMAANAETAGNSIT
jgi:hypothetical protein